VRESVSATPYLEQAVIEESCPFLFFLLHILLLLFFLFLTPTCIRKGVQSLLDEAVMGLEEVKLRFTLRG
jgi:hypothetical protein